MRQREITLEVIIRRKTALDALDDALIFAGLAVNLTAENQGIQTVLLVEHGNHAAFNRLNDYDAGIHTGFFICHVDHPVAESAQEAAFTELNHALCFGRNAARHLNRGKSGSVKLNHDG